uniref:Uncharacterized protein n=1 Tax=Arundo donax TaxID=35708 RepID=A0A0A9HDB4_ARUDO
MSCMRPSFFLFTFSLSFNIAPHKLKILRGTIINTIDTILVGGLGLPLYRSFSTSCDFTSS